ncbi:hypothetical protein SOVF_128670 isoform A [Spinacia oleracea]|nr:hypothetical protein SOVF_128670 isoform A [Spinacia oleracea]
MDGWQQFLEILAHFLESQQDTRIEFIVIWLSGEKELEAQ